MPRQIVPKKDTPVVVKTQNSIHTKHNPHKGHSHKTDNNNTTNPSSSANSRPKTAKTNQHQLNHHQSNSSRFELSSEQWKCTKCGNVNKEINIKCKCKFILLISIHIQFVNIYEEVKAVMIECILLNYNIIINLI